MLGPAVLRLSNVYLDSLEFRSRALKWAEELARRTGASVRAGVLLLDDVIIVHHEPRPDGSRQMPEVGFVIPAHASALGKALLAFRPDDARAANRDAAQHDRRNHHRPADCSTAPRRDHPDGVATEHDEAVLGESSVAAPVFDATGAAVGAIAGRVASPPNGRRRPSLHDDVREAARNISRELGASGWPVYQRRHRRRRARSRRLRAQSDTGA